MKLRLFPVITKMTNPSKQKESEIQSQICEYLSYRKDLMFWRQNSVPIFQPDKNGGRFRRMPKWTMAGLPDIIVIKGGQFIGFEVKGKSKQSNNQKKFQAKLEKAGGWYFVVHSVEETEKALKGL